MNLSFISKTLVKLSPNDSQVVQDKAIQVHGIKNNILGATLLTTNIFILILNFLTILVISRFRHKNAIDIFVLTLAVVDFIKGLIPVPISTYIYLTDWYLKPGSLECNFFGWIAFTTNSGAMLILTLMSVERFWAVVNPFGYKRYITVRRVKIVSTVAMVFTSLHSALPCFGVGRMLPYNNGAYSHFDYSRYSYGTIAYSIFVICYGYGMIFVVMVMYSLVFYKIRDLIHRHRRMSKHRNSNKCNANYKKSRVDNGLNLKTEKMFSYLTVALMVLFMIGWLPFLMVVLANQLKRKPPHAKLDLYAIRIAVINSLLNPIAYAALCKPYRRGILYYFRVLCSYAGFKKPNSDIWDPWRRRRTTVRQYERKKSDVSDPRYVSVSEFGQSSFTDSANTNNTDEYGRHRLPSDLETYEAFRRRGSKTDSKHYNLRLPDKRLPTLNESKSNTTTLEKKGKKEVNAMNDNTCNCSNLNKVVHDKESLDSCDVFEIDSDVNKNYTKEFSGNNETKDQRRKLQLIDRVQKYLSPKRENADRRNSQEIEESEILLKDKTNIFIQRPTEDVNDEFVKPVTANLDFDEDVLNNDIKSGEIIVVENDNLFPITKRTEYLNHSEREDSLLSSTSSLSTSF